MLLGRSLRDVTILLVQALIMIVLAIPFGLTIDPAGVAVTLGLLALVGLVVAPLSYAAALKLKSEDAFAPLVQGIVMPLLLLSGILLPMALAPEWLQTPERHQPADPRGRRCPGAVQQRLGQPGDRDRGGHHEHPRGRRGVGRAPARSAGRRPDRTGHGARQRNVWRASPCSALAMMRS